MKPLMFFITISTIVALLLYQTSLLSMSYVLLMSSVVLGFLMASLISVSWMFYMTTLVYAGGIMLLYTYTSSLLYNNEPITVSMTSLSRWTIVVMASVVTSMLMNPSIFNLSLELKISSLFENWMVIALIFCVAYLMTVMITSLKISLSWHGPLKSKF